MGRPSKTNVYKASATALGDLAQPLRDAAEKMLESADRVHTTVYDFEWEGEAKDSADGRADRELVQDRIVGSAQHALADAYDNAAKSMQPMIDGLKSKGQGRTNARHLGRFTVESRPAPMTGAWRRRWTRTTMTGELRGCRRRFRSRGYVPSPGKVWCASRNGYHNATC